MNIYKVFNLTKWYNNTHRFNIITITYQDI